MRVKICGLRDPAAFRAVAEAGADWVGLNFFPPSPRFITPEQAALLSGSYRGGPKRVGLFVKPDDAEISAALAAIDLDVLQIYADATRAAAIKTRFGRPVWRAVGVSSAADLPREAGGVDGFMIESKPPSGATRPGGNAVPIDWTITAGWQSPLPWMLAGGLDAGNVAEAIRLSGTSAVDVSSGVERSRGVKDPDMIRAFVRAARRQCSGTSNTA